MIKTRRVLASLVWGSSMLWMSFATAGDAPTRPATTEVALNHFYVVLDDETYSAVVASKFFREQFAVVDTGLPKFAAPDAQSARFYVRGKHTYIELLSPANPFNEPIGKIGIALGVDELARLEDVKRIWSERLEGKVERTRAQWTKSEKPVPWYDVVQLDRTADNSHTVLWTAAYLPEFLPWLYPQRSPRENGVARADFLAPRFASDRLFKDVVGLVIALPADLRRDLARQLEVLGYARGDSGNAVTLEGGGWKLTLVETTPERSRLMEVELETNREAASLGTVNLGARSALTFKAGRAATWRLQ